MNDLFAFIAFLANLAFFIWFGVTLNAINRRLEIIAEHTQQQTLLLGIVANVAVGPAGATATGPKPSSPTKPPPLKGFFSDDSA